MSPVAGTRAPRSTKEDRRQALVQAAFNQIAERGFEGLRTREVAAGVGLNIATHQQPAGAAGHRGRIVDP